jgi:hypothetical protein
MPHIVRQDIDEDTIMVRIGKQSLQRPELAELVEQSLRLAGRGRPEQLDHNVAAMASLVVHQKQLSGTEGTTFARELLQALRVLHAMGFIEHLHAGEVARLIAPQRMAVKLNNQDLRKGSLHLVVRQVIKFEANPFLEENLERGIYRRAGAEEPEIAQQRKPRNEGFVAFVSENVEDPAEGGPCFAGRINPLARINPLFFIGFDNGIAQMPSLHRA